MDDIAWTNEPESAKTLIYNLLTLTRILSPTGMEQEMTNYCAGELIRCGFETHVDAYGNIMAIRGRGTQDKFVLLNAHMDTVGINKPRTGFVLNDLFRQKRDEILTRRFFYKCKFVADDKAYIEAKSRFDDSGTLAFRTKEFRKEYEDMHDLFQKELTDLEQYVRDNQNNPEVWMRAVSNPWQPERIVYDTVSTKLNIVGSRSVDMYMGGDDKAGVAMILTLAQITTLPFKVLLTVSEESASVKIESNEMDTYGKSRKYEREYYGIQLVPREFYNDVAFDLTLDKGEGDLLVDRIMGDKLHPNEMSKYLIGISEVAGHPIHLRDGLRCDAYFMRQFLPSANMSTGYQGAHHPFDYINCVDCHNMMKVVKSIIEEFNREPVEFDVVKPREFGERYEEPKKRKKEIENVEPPTEISKELIDEIEFRVRSGYTYMEDGRRILDILPRGYVTARGYISEMEKKEKKEKSKSKRGKAKSAGELALERGLTPEEEAAILWYEGMGYPREEILGWQEFQHHVDNQSPQTVKKTKRTQKAVQGSDDYRENVKLANEIALEIGLTPDEESRVSDLLNGGFTPREIISRNLYLT